MKIKNTFYHFRYLLICVLFLISCSKNKQNDCHCTTEYNQTTTYYPDDFVWYQDTCWHCIFQGRGVDPGSVDDDVWEFCGAD